MDAGLETPGPTPSLFRGALDYLDRKINPVLLRDLRLYMRGRLMLGAYFLTLIALVLVAVLYAIIARFDTTDGTALLKLLTTILAVICGAMIPNLIFERFRAELSNRATELALTSPLTAAQLVRGKLLGAWCMVLMVVSASAPMLATAYLLGGINLLSILGAVGGVTLAGFILPILQLYLAADYKGGKGASRAIAALLFVAQLIMMFGYASLLNDVFAGSYSYRGQYLVPMLVSLVIAGVLVGQFLYCCTVSVIRGEAENRDVAPRVSLFVASLLGGAGVCGVYRYMEGWGSRAPVWETLMLAVSIIAYAFCISFTAVTHSSPSIPRNLHDKWRGKRLRSLFLLPGTGSLTAYFLACAALFFVAPMLVGLYDIHPARREDWWYFLCVGMAPYMGIGYGIVAYKFAVLPLVNDKKNPKLLSHTITIINIVLAFGAIFCMILVSYVWEKSEFYQVVLGVTPVGLVTAARDASELGEGAGTVGIFVCCVLTALLLSIVWKGETAGGEDAGKTIDAPQ